MLSALIAFLASSIITALVIRTQKLHQHLSGDFLMEGPQKFHAASVPRIGGVAIALGAILAAIINHRNGPSQNFEYALLLCATPVFMVGLVEDVTKKVSIKARLLFTLIGALLSVFLLGAQITRFGIPIADNILSVPMLSILFTIFAITGLSNAYNIIDGFNGLSSMVGIITLSAIGCISITLGDGLMSSLSFYMASAILGFFIWNYPRGLIFLGDGGAYLIGFWAAVLSVLIVARHPDVSPWFAVLINGYPILETLFTIYRRKIHQGKSPGQPDGIHFHSLIFRRILNSKTIKGEHEWFSANAKTSPYLWVLASLSIVPSLLFWDDTVKLMFFALLFTLSYLWLYRSIVTFKTPRWMHIH